MLDQLMKLVEQNAGEAIIKNKAIPDQHNSAAIQTVAQQIFSGLQSQASQGNLTQIAGLFQGGTSNLGNNPIVSQLVSSVAGSVASKFGISQQAAQSMAASLLPTVMNQLVKKTNDPKDNSFDLTNIMKGVSGNSNLDVASIIGQVAGAGGKSPLGGLGGMLSGMFGKK
jgi:S-formylglutathione hydrolase FrmB